MSSLFGPDSQFDIEHILPWSRSYDDSFRNKTLCDKTFNRQFKKNLTPFEYAKTLSETAREDFFAQARNLLPASKYWRFCQEVIDDDFVSRQLNDTRYVTKEACKLVK
jgi:CRISPR-associated endonuclease Csn1